MFNTLKRHFDEDIEDYKINRLGYVGEGAKRDTRHSIVMIRALLYFKGE